MKSFEHHSEDPAAVLEPGQLSTANPARSHRPC